MRKRMAELERDVKLANDLTSFNAAKSDRISEKMARAKASILKTYGTLFEGRVMVGMRLGGLATKRNTWGTLQGVE